MAGLRAAWGALKQTNLFFGLMRQFGVTRAQAMRLAGPEFARAVPALGRAVGARGRGREPACR